MLPTFAIRDLNGPDNPGIIQITATQYDHTLRSEPDAALMYLDHDDGELVTVGSGLELSQRLEEAVPVAPQMCLPDNQNGKMHAFDIMHVDNVLVTWKDHEAYSSKALRPRDSCPPTDTPTEEERGVCRKDASQTSAKPALPPFLPNLMEDPTASEASWLEDERLDMRLWTDKTKTFTVLARLVDLTMTFGEAASAKVWLLKSNGVRISVPPGKLSTGDLEYVYRVTQKEGQEMPMCKEYILQLILVSPHHVKQRQKSDARMPTHAATSSADPVQLTHVENPGSIDVSNSAKVVAEPAGPEDKVLTTKPSITNTVFEEVLTIGLIFAGFLRVTADTLSEIADKKGDTSTVEDVLDGFRTIVMEAGKMGMEVLEAVNRDGPSVANAAVSSVQAAIDQARIPQPQNESPDVEKETSAEVIAGLVAPPESQDDASPVHGSFIVADNFDDDEEYAKSINTRYMNSLASDLQHDATKPAAQGSSGTLSIKPSVTCQPSDESNDVVTTFAQSPRSLEHTIATAVLQPDLWPDVVPFWSNGSTGSKSFRRPECCDHRKSILDTDTADQDFSTRYPPLMSVRRSKTVGNLRERSRSPSSRPFLNTKSALSRYPSVSQLEQRHRTQRPARKISISDLLSYEAPKANLKDVNPAAVTSHTFPEKNCRISAWSTQDRGLVDVEKGRQVEQLDESNVDTMTLSPSLPGAWPNQMTSSNPDRTGSQANIPKIATVGASRNGAAYVSDDEGDLDYFSESKAMRRRRERERKREELLASSPMDKTDPAQENEVPRHFRPLAIPEKQISGIPIRRANTIATNPAARLTRPFDPLGPDAPAHRLHRPNKVHYPEIPQASDPWAEMLKSVPSNRRDGSPPSNLHLDTTSTNDISYISPPSPTPRRARSVHFTHIPTETRTQSPPYPTPRTWQTPVGTLPRATEPSFPRPIPPPHHSRRGRNGRIPRPLPTRKVEQCVAQLEAMGYGQDDVNEKARMYVYASAAEGDVMDAVDIIEEERRAVQEMEMEMGIRGGRDTSERGDATEVYDEGRIRLGEGEGEREGEEDEESGISMTESGRLLREI